MYPALSSLVDNLLSGRVRLRRRVFISSGSELLSCAFSYQT